MEVAREDIQGSYEDVLVRFKLQFGSRKFLEMQLVIAFRQ